MNVGLTLQRMDSTINVDAVCEGTATSSATRRALSVEQAETFYLSYLNYALPEKARAYEEQFPGRYRHVEPFVCPHLVGCDLYGDRGGRSGAHSDLGPRQRRGALCHLHDRRTTALLS